MTDVVRGTTQTDLALFLKFRLILVILHAFFGLLCMSALLLCTFFFQQAYDAK